VFPLLQVPSETATPAPARYGLRPYADKVPVYDRREGASNTSHANAVAIGRGNAKKKMHNNEIDVLWCLFPLRSKYRTIRTKYAEIRAKDNEK
jgi:hypothetical protein